MNSGSGIPFRERFDNDKNLSSKRKTLSAFSFILIFLTFTGAHIKEANTLFFKIDFTNEHGITTLLFITVIYNLIRYYNYAQPYHHELFELWAKRLMNDPEIFRYQSADDGIYGLLQKAVDVLCSDEPGIVSAKYQISGIFQRRLHYPGGYLSHRGEDDFFDAYIDLTKWTKDWKWGNYLTLLRYELIYQLQAYLKHREHLDLLGPYLVGLLAISCFAYKAL